MWLGQCRFLWTSCLDLRSTSQAPYWCTLFQASRLVAVASRLGNTPTRVRLLAQRASCALSPIAPSRACGVWWCVVALSLAFHVRQTQKVAGRSMAFHLVSRVSEARGPQTSFSRKDASLLLSVVPFPHFLLLLNSQACRHPYPPMSHSAQKFPSSASASSRASRS